jgi:ParB family chromosome partitioning protein
MAERRRGLGRGLGALIPPVPVGTPRPMDVFFEDAPPRRRSTDRLEVLDDEGRPLEDAPSGAADPEATSGAPAGPDASDSAQGGLEGLLPVPGAQFRELPLDQVVPNPKQPRRTFDEDAMAELVHSVREIGVLQPVVVREVPRTGAGSPDDDAPRFELVMGERRWRASQLAGVATIPAIIRDTPDDDLLRDALLENLHRSELNPLEEAAAYQQLLDDFGCTHDHLAQRIGRSRPQISNTIRLLRLPPLVQRRVAAGVLTAGHARALLGLADGAAIERLAQRIVAEGLSVRATEEVVAMGGGDEVPLVRRRGAAAPLPPAFDHLVGRLSDRLETRVSVAMGQRRGKLTVEFAGVEDLNRIIAALAPGDPGITEE